mmetsp:Transcript_11692/g.21923  ORF Transcript_11692/g.21923 Transcript_11692/m.21923 type:complete len:212 (+) Transcript_11692:1075-1710(+)
MRWRLFAVRVARIELFRQSSNVFCIELTNLKLSENVLNRLVPQVLLVNLPERFDRLSSSEHDFRHPSRVVLHELGNVVHLASVNNPDSFALFVVLGDVVSSEDRPRLLLLFFRMCNLRHESGPNETGCKKRPERTHFFRERKRNPPPSCRRGGRSITSRHALAKGLDLLFSASCSSVTTRSRRCYSRLPWQSLSRCLCLCRLHCRACRRKY